MVGGGVGRPVIPVREPSPRGVPQNMVVSEIPVYAYTYASSGRTANPKKSKTAPITTDLAHLETAQFWGHGDLIPHGPGPVNRNRRP